MKLYEETEKIKASGYSEQNAQSKLGQDILRGMISVSSLSTADTRVTAMEKKLRDRSLN